jgi:hypothetical protein
MEKSKLFEDRIPQETVELRGIGTITVRGLSRYELLLAGKLADDRGAAVMEQHMLAFAMVDPEMSTDDVKAWQKASQAGEIAPVIAAVNRLSGTAQGADKSSVPSDGDGSESGV